MSLDEFHNPIFRDYICVSLNAIYHFASWSGLDILRIFYFLWRVLAFGEELPYNSTKVNWNASHNHILYTRKHLHYMTPRSTYTYNIQNTTLIKKISIIIIYHDGILVRSLNAQCTHALSKYYYTYIFFIKVFLKRGISLIQKIYVE